LAQRCRDSPALLNKMGGFHVDPQPFEKGKGQPAANDVQINHG
jgi:hypothetical protein